MGSVGAVLSRRDVASPDPVKRMLYAAPHRGDTTEVIVAGDCALGIAYERGARDAWLWKNGHIATVFSGTLDNAPELASDLQNEASNPPMDPAEIVGRLFLRQGPSVASAMRGGFAALMTDGRSLWSIRDQIGFAPLHHRTDGNGSYFASEAKQVVAGAGIALEPDLDLLERMYFWNFERALACPLQGVERVPKATVGRTGRGPIAFTRYWHPEEVLESARFSDDEVVERFERLMTQATTRSLQGDDVVSLSGGIDSPAVAAYAGPEYRERFGGSLSALSEVFPAHPSVDETKYIRLIAERLGLDLHTYEPQPRRLGELDKWAELCDGPVPTWSPNDDFEYYLKARELGFRNILTGGLAESVVDQRHQVIGHLLWKGRLRSLGAHLKQRRAKGATIGRLAHDIASALMPRRVQAANMKRKDSFFGAPIPQWMDEQRLKETWDRVCVPAPDRWKRAQLSDVGEVPSPSMEAQEILQTSVGVRVRRPWADVDLWEFFLSLRAETKFPSHGHKVLVRRLLRERLPDEVLDRTDKTVFNDWAMAEVDYDSLRRWLVDPPHRLRGIDYALLAESLESEKMDFIGVLRAQDLAFIHAFLDRWR